MGWLLSSIKGTVRVVSISLKPAYKVIIAILGSIVILAGFIMLVTPGPGILAILLGLLILASEFVWAKRLLKKMKEKFKKFTRKKEN